MDNNDHIGIEKFNTCAFRSNEKISKTITRCPCQGGNYEISGYQCIKRDIFNVDEMVCYYCDSFEEK